MHVIRHLLLVLNKNVNFLFAILINSIEPKPAGKASQEIRRILSNLEVQYRIQKSRPSVPKQERSISSMLSSHHFNIVFPSTPRSCMWPLSLRFIHQNHLCTSPLPYTRYLPRLSHCTGFHQPNNVWWCVQLVAICYIISGSFLL
jgi:hypothetical protein